MRIKLFSCITLMLLILSATGCKQKEMISPENQAENEPAVQKETNIQKEIPVVKTPEQKAPIVKQVEAVKVTFVELGSDNCMPCRMMKPVMKEIEDKYTAKGVKVIFYDVWTDAGKPYAEKYAIEAIPTQVFLDKDGKEFFRHVGFYPVADIEKVLQKQGVK
ncbi:MAG: hypothetical protein A3J83_05990 [Elusimicrobia bacterium RIFOXYA2_FULL_40_6]|nr:MAG: hypothetical protein A3J83_05990 [Elusimicrobia bacterium RIFOXYA2_FULL_40_6]